VLRRRPGSRGRGLCTLRDHQSEYAAPVHQRLPSPRGSERESAERDATRLDARAAAVLALQRTAGNRAVAATVARFTRAGFDRPVPVDFDVAIEEMTLKELTEIAGLLAGGDLQADATELQRLADRARALGEEAVAARVEVVPAAPQSDAQESELNPVTGKPFDKATPPKSGTPEAEYRPCFVAGTLVDVGTAGVPIERLARGDRVHAREQGRPQTERSYEVLAAPQGRTDRLVRVTVGADMITCTRHHAFSVVGKGWVKASQLVVDDELETRSGDDATITAVEAVHVGEEIQTYSLIVDEVSTFFVHAGRASILVHNGGPEDWDRELWWLFDKAPKLRDTDTDGQSLWRTRSRAEVETFMRVRVHEMTRTVGTIHAYYTPEQFTAAGLRIDESPANNRPAAAGLQHGSLRPADAAVFDPSKPKDQGPNVLTLDQMNAIRAAYAKLQPAGRLKPKDLKC
jgi:Pretoxin HINT domain